MEDIISRKALLEEYDRTHRGQAGIERSLIENASAVKGIKKESHAHWIRLIYWTGESEKTCSKCGRREMSKEKETITPFCSGCGATMDERDDDVKEIKEHEKILPCPVCGSKMLILDYTDHIYGFRGFKLRCNNYPICNWACDCSLSSRFLSALSFGYGGIVGFSGGFRVYDALKKINAQGSVSWSAAPITLIHQSSLYTNKPAQFNGGISVSGSTLRYIVAEGNIGDFFYREWSDKFLEQWGYAETTFGSCNQSGSLYYTGNSLTVSFPFEFTGGILTCHASAYCRNNAHGILWVQGSSTKEQSETYTLARATSWSADQNSINWGVSIYATGFVN